MLCVSGMVADKRPRELIAWQDEMDIQGTGAGLEDAAHVAVLR